MDTTTHASRVIHLQRPPLNGVLGRPWAGLLDLLLVARQLLIQGLDLLIGPEFMAISKLRTKAQEGRVVDQGAK